MKVVTVSLTAGPKLIGGQKALQSIENSLQMVRSMQGFTKKHLKKAEVIAEMLGDIVEEMEAEEEQD